MLVRKHFLKKHYQKHPMFIFLMEFIRCILSKLNFLILRRLWSTLLLYFACGACGSKFSFVSTDAVQERLYSWLSKTQNFFSETLVKTGQSAKRIPEHAFDSQDMGDIFMAEQTIDGRTPNGNLSLAAIVSIEQFSRCS